jgi:DNA-binding CsgD family transcriptional regulator
VRRRGLLFLIVGGVCGWTWANAVLASRTRRGDLTERQAHILALVARGLSTKEIARREGISANSVNTHIRRARSTLGVSSRAAAAAIVIGRHPTVEPERFQAVTPARPRRSATRARAATISPTSSSNGT